jgi:ribosomal protein L40E
MQLIHRVPPHKFETMLANPRLFWYHPPRMSKSEENSVIQCPKCKKETSVLQDHCEKCGGHLFIVCRECGTKNLRTETKCENCGSNFHRQKRKRRQDKIEISDNLTTILAPILILGFLILVYFLTKKFLIK